MSFPVNQSGGHISNGHINVMHLLIEAMMQEASSDRKICFRIEWPNIAVDVDWQTLSEIYGADFIYRRAQLLMSGTQSGAQVPNGHINVIKVFALNDSIYVVRSTDGINSFCFWIRILILIKIWFSLGSSSPIYSRTAQWVLQNQFHCRLEMKRPGKTKF